MIYLLSSSFVENYRLTRSCFKLVLMCIIFGFISFTKRTINMHFFAVKHHVDYYEKKMCWLFSDLKRQAWKRDNSSCVFHALLSNLLLCVIIFSQHLIQCIYRLIFRGDTWARVAVWLIIGVFVYVFYGRTHSSLEDAVYVPAAHANEIFRSSGNYVAWFLHL